MTRSDDDEQTALLDDSWRASVYGQWLANFIRDHYPEDSDELILAVLSRSGDPPD